MNTLPLIRANVLLPIMQLLNQENIPSQQLLQMGKLPDIVLEEPETLISLYQAFNTVERFARREGIELLGVLASQQFQLIDIGLFGKVVSQSLTGYDLLQTIVALLTKTYSSGDRNLSYSLRRGFALINSITRSPFLNYCYIFPSNDRETTSNPIYKLVDIAFGLGYTTPANFTRAFQRWAGVSPSKFRHLELVNNPIENNQNEMIRLN